MKTQHHSITTFLLLLLFATAVNAQGKKQKTSVEPNKSISASPSKKKELMDSTRIKKDVHVEKKHKQADSARIWNEAQIEIKHKQANSIRVEKDVQIEKKHMQKDSLKSIQHEKKSAPARKKDPMENVKSKKVVMSIPCQPDATVTLRNIMRHVDVLTTNDNKVTLVAIVQYEGQSVLTDKEWFSKLNISLAENGNIVEVNTGEVENNLNGEGLVDMVYNGVTVFDSLGNATNRRSKADREIILYLPKCANVNIESKHADITFGNNTQY